MLTLPRALALIFALIAGYVFVLAPRVAAQPTGYPDSSEVAVKLPPPPPPGAPRPVFPPAGTAFFGAFTHTGPADFTDLDRFVAAAGRRPQVMLFAQGWAVDRFDRRPFDRVASRGMLPIMGWEPWDYRLEPKVVQLRPVQPRYRLARIAGGAFDAYIRSFAVGIRGLGYAIGIRFAHEMNGNWYPWGESVNGNQPGDYARAWRHVHDIFREAGADNVIWIWSPNLSYRSSTPLAELYPGDTYVDWVGLSGYYGTAGLENYRTFGQIFASTLTEVHAVTARPIVLTEVAATNAAGRKAEWVRDFLRELPRHPDIIGFIWYEAVKETDWRIAGSPAAAAFAAGVAQPYFDAAWSPYAVPRTSTVFSAAQPPPGSGPPARP